MDGRPAASIERRRWPHIELRTDVETLPTCARSVVRRPRQEQPEARSIQSRTAGPSWQLDGMPPTRSGHQRPSSSGNRLMTNAVRYLPATESASLRPSSVTLEAVACREPRVTPGAQWDRCRSQERDDLISVDAACDYDPDHIMRDQTSRGGACPLWRASDKYRTSIPSLWLFAATPKGSGAWQRRYIRYDRHARCGLIVKGS